MIAHKDLQVSNPDPGIILFFFLNFFQTLVDVPLGGIWVTCSPRDPMLAGLNPTEVDGFFSGHKNPENKSSGRDFKLRVPCRFQAR